MPSEGTRTIKRFAQYLGIAVLLSVMVVIALLLIDPEQPTFPGTNGNFIVQNISIVDVESGSLIANANLQITNGKLHAITNSLNSPPANHRVIPGDGLYLMPGLWDMHTHSLKLSPQLHHPLFISQGVTSVRDMSGCLSKEDDYWACPNDRKEWNRMSRSGEIAAPYYVLQSGYQTNGGNEVPGDFPDFFRLRSQDDADQMVTFYEEQGADFIKTYTELTPSQFEQLTLATRDSDIYLAGHKPLTTSLEDAISAEMRSLEHGRLFMFECYSQIDEFRSEANPLSTYDAQKISRIMKHQNSENCTGKMQMMAASNTHWVPTLTTLKMSAMARDVSFREDRRLKFIPTVVKALLWNQDANRAATRGYDDQGEYVHTLYFEQAAKHVNQAHKLGVKILAGTDNIDTYVFSGSSLHDEMAMLAESGLSNVDVLRAATIHAAEFSGLAEQTGSIRVGKTADLVFLSANPLEDIANTTAIVGVMFGGHYFDQAALKALENRVQQSASSLHINLHYLADLLLSPLMRVQLAD